MATARELRSKHRRLRRDYTPAPQISQAYLLGLLHDATVRKNTYRIGQNNKRFIDFLSQQIKSLGANAWTYQEGKNRKFYIVEFSKKLLAKTKISNKQDKIDYIRGYFDAEGGIAHQSQVRFYIYFSQKDKKDLETVKQYLSSIGIICGKTHNPSQKVDPKYWRFFISSRSYRDFANIVGSFHPVKNRLLRMKR